MILECSQYLIFKSEAINLCMLKIKKVTPTEGLSCDLLIHVYITKYIDQNT